jgi:hypothetical protein
MSQKKKKKERKKDTKIQQVFRIGINAFNKLYLIVLKMNWPDFIELIYNNVIN